MLTTAGTNSTLVPPSSFVSRRAVLSDSVESARTAGSGSERGRFQCSAKTVPLIARPEASRALQNFVDVELGGAVELDAVEADFLEDAELVGERAGQIDHAQFERFFDLARRGRIGAPNSLRPATRPAVAAAATPWRETSGWDIGSSTTLS